MSQERLATLITAYLTEDQGEPAPPAVVTALAIAGLGHLHTSAGVGLPISKATEYKQLAAYLVDHYLRGTRPSPGNNYLVQMKQLIGSRLAGKTPTAVSQAQLRALAALTLGHMTDFRPPVARTVAAVRTAEVYLAGIEPA